MIYVETAVTIQTEMDLHKDMTFGMEDKLAKLIQQLRRFKRPNYYY